MPIDTSTVRGLSMTDAMRAQKDLHRYSAWLVVLGIIMAILGLYAVSAAVMTTFASMVVLGMILLIAAGVHFVRAFIGFKWGAFFGHLLLAVLFAFAGVATLQAPMPAALGVTLMLGSLLIFAGIVRCVASLMGDMPHKGWAVFNGVITFILGLMIVNQWPASGLWVIGLFIGIDLLIDGVGLTVLGFQSRPSREGRSVDRQIPTHGGVAPT